MPGTFVTDLTNFASTYTYSGSVGWVVNPAARAQITLPGATSIIGMTDATIGSQARMATGTVVTANMSATGTAAKCMYMWGYIGSGSKADLKANGGLCVSLGSGVATVAGTAPNFGLTTTSKIWRVMGNDTDIFGGFMQFVVSPRVTADATAGVINTAAITAAAMVVKQAIVGSDVVPDVGHAAWRVGSGHTFTGGTAVAPVTFADAALFDRASSYGVCRLRAGTITLQGKLFCGTATQVALTVFKDTTSIVVLPDNPVDQGFYELVATGTASFSSTFQTGDYTAGKVSLGRPFTSVGATSKLTLSCGNVYGFHKHYGMSASLAASTLNAGSELRGCSFTGSLALTPAGAVVNDCVFAGGTDAAMVLTTPSDATPTANCNFSGNAVGIRITAAGTYTLDGHTFSGNTVDIQNTSIGAVIINVVNGSNPVSTQNTGGGTITINITAGATVSGLVTGSRVVIKRTDTGAVLFNGAESLGSVSYSGTYVGQVTVIARKASGAPYYKEWTTLVSLVSGSSVSVTAQQVFDT